MHQGSLIFFTTQLMYIYPQKWAKNGPLGLKGLKPFRRCSLSQKCKVTHILCCKLYTETIGFVDRDVIRLRFLRKFYKSYASTNWFVYTINNHTNQLSVHQTWNEKTSNAFNITLIQYCVKGNFCVFFSCNILM